MKDFAFQTYVDPLTIALQWDKTQLVAGVATPLTLTETLVFPSYALPGALAQPNVLIPVWTVKSDNLPAWFSVASVACSSQIAAADCIVANIAPGSSISVIPDGIPVTLTLTGTASPAAAGTGTGKAEACVDYPEVIVDVTPAQTTVTVCVSDQQAVAVVAPAATEAPATAPAATEAPATAAPATAAPTVAPTPAPTAAPTAPPTSLDGSPTPTEPGLAVWLLAACLAAGGGTILLLGRRPGRTR